MLGHLDLEPGLQNVAHQIRQQAALTGERDAVLTRLSDQLLGPLTHRPRRTNRHQLATQAAALPVLVLLHHRCAPSCRRHSAGSDQTTPLTQSFGQTRGRRLQCGTRRSCAAHSESIAQEHERIGVTSGSTAVHVLAARRSACLKAPVQQHWVASLALRRKP